MGEPVILIADDSRMIRRILVDNLSNYGYRVIESENGDVALTLTLEHHPDLIISDINMPIMDGFDFCWSVKKTEAIRHIPFIFLTTRDEISDKVRGRNLGAAEYVNKPFDMEHLLPLIQRLLEKRPKAYSPENTPGRFALSGELDKMPITELLQLFSLNSKTGKLILKSQGQQGYIYFQTGNIINAQLNKLSGTKALYRLLGIEEGTFVFEDGLNSVPVEMEKNTLKLLIEGLRQLDEMKPIFQALLGKRLFIKFERPLFEWGLHEATPRMCQLLSEIARTPKFEELLDSSNQPDLDICKALELFISKHILDSQI